ncbi:MAG TPA: sugar ABC transporter permease [Chloroflexota bacterium]|nr:sugar ABC transporter permease [Chloroflexota bacterium]
MARVGSRPTPTMATRPLLPPIWREIWRHRLEYLFVSPFFVIFGIFHLYPLLWAFYLSFQRWSGFGPMVFVGLDDYRAVFTEAQVQQALLNTLIFAVVLVPTGILLSLTFAVLLNRRDLRGRGVLRTIYFLPFITSAVIVAFVFQMLFDNSYGWINDLLKALNLTPLKWFSVGALAKVVIVVLAHWRGLGYSTLIMLGGLQGIAPDVYEAAAIDGAGRWRIFWDVTVPLMRPVMLFVTVIGTIGVLNMFNEPFILTQGGPGNATLTLTLRLYQLAFQTTRYGDGAALGFLIGVLIVAITMTQMRLLRSWRQ